MRISTRLKGECEQRKMAVIQDYEVPNGPCHYEVSNCTHVFAEKASGAYGAIAANCSMACITRGICPLLTSHEQ